jgi:hypothetical protein
MEMDHADLELAREDLDFTLAIGTDERGVGASERYRLYKCSEMCSTSGRANEAKWQLDPAQLIDVQTAGERTGGSQLFSS